MTDAIREDASNESTDATFDAEGAFLSMWGDEDGEGLSKTPRKKQPEIDSDDADQEADEDDSDKDVEDEGSDDPEAADDPEETEGEDAEDEEADEKKPSKTADDDAEVEIEVDGEKRRASVKDLKRLYGQEASLTRKSMEVAAAKKTAETAHHTYATALQVMAGKAQEAFKPYANIDWLLAQKQLDADDFAALRQEAQAKFEQAKFFGEELDKTMKDREGVIRSQLVEEAKKATEVLNDSTSPHHIPNWSRETFGKLREFAVGAGITEEVIDTIVDPAALKIIYDAMQFRTAKKVAVKKKAKASPTRSVSTKESPSGGSTRFARAQKAMRKLNSSGDVEDAAAAFMAGWGSEDD